MTPQEIGTLAAQVGVPSVALALVGRWISKRIEAADAAASLREEAANARTAEVQKKAEEREDECRKEGKRLNQDLRNLEREIRNEFVPLVKECTRELQSSRRNSDAVLAIIEEHRARQEREGHHQTDRRRGDQGQAQGHAG